MPASELGLKVLSEIGRITSTMEPEIDAPVVRRSGNRHHLTFDTYEEGRLTLEEYLGRVVFHQKRPFTGELASFGLHNAGGVIRETR